MINNRKEFIINNIYPVYQPIIDIYSYKPDGTYIIKKFEALVRSKDINGKTLFPNFLLQYLDKQIITEKMFNKVIKDINKYKIDVSFNISLSDISNEKIVNLFFETLEKETNIGNKLTFEFIEEEEIIKNKFLVKSFIKEVHNNFKSKVALDDFGKGYATFEPILEFEFDIIKLDKVIIQNFLSNPTNYYLLDNLIKIFNRLEKEVIAEYIEKKEELAALKYLSCRYAQGYYISPPKALKEFFQPFNIYKI